MEPYVLGAPKRVEVGGVTFLIKKARSWRVQKHLQTIMPKLQEEGATSEETAALVEEALSHIIIGWENVVDEAGQAVPFSMEAMQELDAQIVFEALTRSLETVEPGKDDASSRLETPSDEATP